MSDFFQLTELLTKISAKLIKSHSCQKILRSHLFFKIIDMETTVRHIITPSYTETTYRRISFWKRFISWSAKQEENRMLWAAIAILGHGCIITIVTMIAIIFSGNHFIYWPFAIGAMAMSVVSYLAALPTKVTIPIFFISLLIDIAIIALCCINGFSGSSVYY
jgi:hypothetical protein